MFLTPVIAVHFLGRRQQRLVSSPPGPTAMAAGGPGEEVSPAGHRHPGDLQLLRLGHQVHLALRRPARFLDAVHHERRQLCTCQRVGVLGGFESGIRPGFTSQAVICSTVRPTVAGCSILSTGTGTENRDGAAYYVSQPLTKLISSSVCLRLLIRR